MSSIAAVLVVASLAGAPVAQGPASPNFIVILLDDIGRDKVAVYGAHPSPAPTPNIDALAAQGMLFRNAWSYPVCSPTRAALLTGRHSDRTGIGWIIAASDSIYTPLQLSETILPEVLPGYTSLASGKWHLRDVGDPLTHPLLSGFDVALGHVGHGQYFDWTAHINGVTRAESGYYPAVLTRRTIDVIDRLPEPFFVYHCPFAAHAPFHVPPQQLHSQGFPTAALGKHIAMVEAIDALIGTLLERVDLTTTYVILLGDNGSPSQTVSPPWSPSHAKGSLYEGGVRIPFIVAGPGVTPGTETRSLVHVTDIFATVRELAGLPPLHGVAEDSVSFAPLLANPQGPGRRNHLYVHQFPLGGTGAQFDDKRALRTERWKLIENVTAQSFELFDLASDPYEMNNLLLSNPGVVTSALKERLLALMPVFP